ncbi:hypothetical protein [Neorhizobium sp. NCHU2750]|uniref:hypothetical protein n=1 Tax=Neorhizobium sp. NCHU2750 TaxID=1825976 RepID=UPI000EB658BD|nr:lipoprotein [Neorhizobium sp. NCHU2750]
MTLRMPAALCCLLALSSLMALAGCQRETNGRLVEVSGRLVVFNYRVAMAHYLVTLRKLQSIPEGSQAEAEFENPKGGDVLKTRERIFAVDDKITLQSPPIHCVVKDRPYAVTIRIVSASGAVLQTLKTSLVSDVDQTVMPAKPLTVGPGYAPNPDVFKADGSVDMAPESSCHA